MWVGISAVGVFETRDGGATWQTRNKGVRADFNPEKYPEFGQCVHKLVLAADGGERLYQQNHCGVYRSTDGGEAWDEITDGPAVAVRLRHGRPPAGPDDRLDDPADRPEDGRLMPDGAPRSGARTTAARPGSAPATACRSRMPIVGVLREAMAVDRLDPVGVYFGTSTGQLYG